MRGLWHQPDLCKTLYSPYLPGVRTNLKANADSYALLRLKTITVFSFLRRPTQGIGLTYETLKITIVIQISAICVDVMGLK